MKIQNNLINLLLISTITLMLIACDSKTAQEENNASPSTQTITNTTELIDSNTSTTPTTSLKSLTLNINKTSLNKEENTTVILKATYDDGTSKALSQNITWISTPNNAVSITNNVLTAKKDRVVTLQARVGNVLSNKVALNIIWAVNGHTLPPEPDKTLNDSTLLGIDVNDNGVRDDVERWIYEEYKDKHPIHIDIAMQATRGYKLVLEAPERAKEIRLKVDAALFCNWYYWKDAKEFNEPLLVEERIDAPVSSKYFNTKDRKDTYLQYDKLLSGGGFMIALGQMR